MLIRLALQADVHEMHAIRLSVRENVLVRPGSVLLDHYRPLLSKEGRGWVAEVDGRIVGFAIVDLVRSSVWALFVRPNFEGQGIGRRLHQMMMNWVFEAGIVQVALSTSPNTRAQGFYLAAGWQPVGSASNGEVRYEMSRERWLVGSYNPNPQNRRSLLTFTTNPRFCNK